MRKLIIAAVAASAMISSAAMASVTFDAGNGMGFVGKGDVQVAFNLNNAALQKNASGVSFNYLVKGTYDVTCEWDTVTGGPRSKTVHHDITIPKNVMVNSGVATDPRVRNQITGFNLTGFGTVTSTGQAEPAIDDACPGNNPGIVTDVMQTSSSAQLFVNYGGNSVDITPPAV